MGTNQIKTKGLTLIELLITLAIVGILLAGATPSMTEFIQNNRAVTQINELQSSLSLARNEAIRRNNNITICRSSNGSSCGGNWQDGWIVFVDNDLDGYRGVSDEILSIHGTLTGGNTLAFSQTRVIYANSGMARSGSNGTFVLCDARGTASSMGIIVGVSGRPRFATSGDIGSFLEIEENAGLACS